MTGVTAGLVVYFMSEGGQYRYLWLASALSFMAGLPWTKLVMMPDIQKLKESDVLERKGTD